MNVNEPCILCGEKLNKYKTNLEHYVPQVLIRNFYKLAVPNKFKYAERINKHQALSEGNIVVPLKDHKKWATVRVHEKCNLEASPMCQDMKKIIDFLDNRPEFTEEYSHEDKRASRIIEYYASIWRTNPENVKFLIRTYQSAHDGMNADSSCLLYKAYEMSCGRFHIYLDYKPHVDEHRHFIYLKETIK